MSVIRKRKLKAMMQAVGLIPPPPEPPRLLTVVPVPWFSEPHEWPAHIASYRAMVAKSQYGIVVDEPTCERVMFEHEQDAFEQYAIAYQKWLTTEGSEKDAQPVATVWERLRQQFRDRQTPAQMN